jgi:hypothetical protein
MKPLMCVMVAGLILSGTAQAERPDGQKAKKHPKYQRVVDDNRDRALEIHVVFSRQESRVIREHYAPLYQNLPPGLEMKVLRTGWLPRGWQRKLEPLPIAIERELVVLPAPYERGVIDGHAVIFNPDTQKIVDVTVLF